MNKKLYRSASNRKICGVCGGLGEYFGIDATILRVIWAISCLFWFVGLIAYFVAALIIPKDPGYIDV